MSDNKLVINLPATPTVIAQANTLEPAVVVVNRGIKGDVGSVGPQGPQGDEGEMGLSELSGNGVPASGLGRVGETYVDVASSNLDLYRKTGASTWTLVGVKRGPQGVAGTTDHLALTNIGTNTHVQIDSHIADTTNPHNTTAIQVGLGNVNNTSDADKPVSTAQQAALDLKVNLTRAINTPSGSGLSGGGDLSADRSLALSQTGVADAGVPSPTDTLWIQTGSGLRTVTVNNLNLGSAENETDIRMFDDWISGTTASKQNWSLPVSGTSASVQFTTAYTTLANKAQGVIQLDTGTTSTGRAGVRFDTSSLLLSADHVLDLEWRFYMDTSLSDATNRYGVIVGLHDTDGSLDATDGIYFRYIDNVSANWQTVISAAGVRTTFTTSTAFDVNTWNKLRISFNGPTNTIEFFINGVSVNSDSTGTNFPINAGQFTTPHVAILKSVGTAQRNIGVDYFKMTLTDGARP